MNRNQAYIAEKMKVSITFVNRLVNTKKRPSWKRAKQIAEITNTDPVLWLDGSKEEIKTAYNGWKRGVA